MNLKLLLIPLLFAIGVVVGWYSHQCQPCQPCIQIKQQTVRQEQAAPALTAVTKTTDREAELQKQIELLHKEASKRPKERTITIVKSVPTECQQHVQRQAAADAGACLETPDLDIINRAKHITEQSK